jgi:uncharacterized membrane protein SpoIIM required for sporulation
VSDTLARTQDREAFSADRRLRWERLELLLAKQPENGEEWVELSGLYRAICADLARARTLQLPDDVVAYLDQLAARAHNAMYGARGVDRPGIVQLLAVEFPRELRRSAVFFAAASALFYGPFLLGMVASIVDPSYASGILPEDQLASMEKMYSGELSREAWQDAGMAGFYVFNNIGIAFRCFATGALFGLGSVWYLVYNGLVIGTVFGYLLAVGRGANLLTYTAGHSPWELTGITVSGTAGLRMGWALIETRGRTRLGSLRAAGPALYRLVAGAAAMLAVAASIEGFWSASPVPVAGKVAFGLLGWVVVGGWLGFGGLPRRGRSAP